MHQPIHLTPRCTNPRPEQHLEKKEAEKEDGSFRSTRRKPSRSHCMWHISREDVSDAHGVTQQSPVADVTPTSSLRSRDRDSWSTSLAVWSLIK